jgi:hypothetical protein
MGLFVGLLSREHCLGFENSKGFLPYTFGSLLDGKYK